jgi:hypothetical protein
MSPITFRSVIGIHTSDLYTQKKEKEKKSILFPQDNSPGFSKIYKHPKTF